MRLLHGFPFFSCGVCLLSQCCGVQKLWQDSLTQFGSKLFVSLGQTNIQTAWEVQTHKTQAAVEQSKLYAIFFFCSPARDGCTMSKSTLSFLLYPESTLICMYCNSFWKYSLEILGQHIRKDGEKTLLRQMATAWGHYKWWPSILFCLLGCLNANMSHSII